MRRRTDARHTSMPLHSRPRPWRTAACLAHSDGVAGRQGRPERRIPRWSMRSVASMKPSDEPQGACILQSFGALTLPIVAPWDLFHCGLAVNPREKGWFPLRVRFLTASIRDVCCQAKHFLHWQRLGSETGFVRLQVKISIIRRAKKLRHQQVNNFPVFYQPPA